MSTASLWICSAAISSNFAPNICQPYFFDTSLFALLTLELHLHFSYFYTFFGHFGAGSPLAPFIWSWSYFRWKCCFEYIFQEFALISLIFGKFHGQIMTFWYSPGCPHCPCCHACCGRIRGCYYFSFSPSFSIKWSRWFGSLWSSRIFCYSWWSNSAPSSSIAASSCLLERSSLMLGTYSWVWSTKLVVLGRPFFWLILSN